MARAASRVPGRLLLLLVALAGLRLGLALAQPPQTQWQSGSIAQLGFGSVSKALQCCAKQGELVLPTARPPAAARRPRPSWLVPNSPTPSPLHSWAQNYSAAAGACGYGDLPASVWPFAATAAIDPAASPFAGGVQQGCGVCLQVTPSCIPPACALSRM